MHLAACPLSHTELLAILYATLYCNLVQILPQIASILARHVHALCLALPWLVPCRPLYIALPSLDLPCWVRFGVIVRVWVRVRGFRTLFLRRAGNMS